jgi:hypothetical protein
MPVITKEQYRLINERRRQEAFERRHFDSADVRDVPEDISLRMRLRLAESRNAKLKTENQKLKEELDALQVKHKRLARSHWGAVKRSIERGKKIELMKKVISGEITLDTSKDGGVKCL